MDPARGALEVPIFGRPYTVRSGDVGCHVKSEIFSIFPESYDSYVCTTRMGMEQRTTPKISCTNSNTSSRTLPRNAFVQVTCTVAESCVSFVDRRLHLSIRRRPTFEMCETLFLWKECVFVHCVCARPGTAACLILLLRSTLLW